MFFQWEPDLTCGKWSKNWNNGRSKQAPVVKKCRKLSQKWPKLFIWSLEMDPNGLSLLCGHFTVIANVTSQGLKTMFPWEQKLEKWQTNYNKGTYIVCGLSDKKKLAPGVPIGDQKSPELSPWIHFFPFFCSNPLNRVPVSLPHPQNNFWGSNVVLFSIPEADFEAEILSPGLDWIHSHQFPS